MGNETMTFSVFLRSLVFAGASLTLSAAQTSQTAKTTYTITDLGTLNGDDESSGFWINNSGSIVGCSDTETIYGYPCTGLVAGQHAFLWTKSGGMQDLGTLSGGTVSAASGINGDGVIVGYSNEAGNLSTNFDAVEWSAGGVITDLGTLWEGSSSAAFAINASGEISGDSFNALGVVKVTNWTNDKIANLGGLPDSIFSAGLTINEDGEIAGESVFSYGPPFTSHAFRWTGSELVDLGTLEGGVTSMGNGINAAGIIVGQSDGALTGGSWHAVKWNSSNVIEDLGMLPGGTYSVAFAVNELETIVGYGNISDNAPHATVWTSANGMQDLNDLISANSGWVLINANSINSSGQITGYGTKGGYNHAFLLTPK
jgi:probable HAF family extracellular repeat protein